VANCSRTRIKEVSSALSDYRVRTHQGDQSLTSNAGNISVEEFGRVMKASGQKVTDAELEQIIKEVDMDGDGTINFQGMFQSLLTSRENYS
jgi:flagellar basal body rod protein FlgG